MRQRLCVECGRPATHGCARCNQPYCSRACQERDWQVHKLDCRQIAASGVNLRDEEAVEEFTEYREEVNRRYRCYLDEQEAVSEESNSESDGSWEPMGARSFYPRPGQRVAQGSPLGRPPDIFRDGRRVDWSFASLDVLKTDREEISSWLVKTLTDYNKCMGCEAEVLLRHPIRRRPSRLKVIYLAGVEGAGHGGVLPLLLYPAVRAYGPGVLASWRSLREVFLKTAPTKRRSKLAKLLQAANVQGKPHVIICSDAWPFGTEDRQHWSQGRLDQLEGSSNPGNSVELSEFVALMSEHAEVKVLALHRSLLSAAYSHKDRDGGIQTHARVLAAFGSYLTGVIDLMDLKSWRWLAYEDLCAAHRRGDFEAVTPISEFLGLPRKHMVRAFRHFTPSRKDANIEVSDVARRTIEQLARRTSQDWFHRRFPDMQLVKGEAQSADRLAAAAQPPVARAAKGALEWLAVRRFRECRAERWEAAMRTSLEDGSGRPGAVEIFESSLYDVELSRFREAMRAAEREEDALRRHDLDASAFTSLHVRLEDSCFCSALNFLLSAVVYCEENDLECVVEDGRWRCGRLHEVLQVDPMVRKESQLSGRTGGLYRPLEVVPGGEATPQLLAVQRHSLTVNQEQKASYARLLWSLTPDARRAVADLHAELGMPPAWGAVHIHAVGDQVSSDLLDVHSWMAANACEDEGVGTLWVCSNDAYAARDLADRLSICAPNLEVRWRRRPLQLQMGASMIQPGERAQELLADFELMREAVVAVCSFACDTGRLLALLREGPTITIDDEWSNT